MTNYDTEYHANLLAQQYRLCPRGTRFMRRGMAHALQHLHEYRSREEAAADIRQAIEPKGIFGFIVSSFFAGLLSWIAERIATYIWEKNWRAAEEHPTELPTLPNTPSRASGPLRH